jgi:hypothetical protein
MGKKNKAAESASLQDPIPRFSPITLESKKVIITHWTRVAQQSDPI